MNNRYYKEQLVCEVMKALIRNHNGCQIEEEIRWVETIKKKDDKMKALEEKLQQAVKKQKDLYKKN